MEQSIKIVGADKAKDFIARQFLGEEHDRSDPIHLGGVTLHPHQAVAVRRLREAMDEFGGAILSDEVGMGKTFVALAIAKEFSRTLIVAPAALRDMWSIESRRAGMHLPFVSVEALSRGHHDLKKFDLVIVDEAHHLRNPKTNRYDRLCRMVARSRVVMLSATPVHNTRRDITALLSIFLGSRARTLTGSELGRCIVRRRVDSADFSKRVPDAKAVEWKEISDNNAIPQSLLALPPPVPPSDGGDGGVFIARSLLRQWCSSDAALEVALRRRLGRAIALTEALQSGHYPSGDELSAWTFAEDSVQLAFPSLVATPIGDASQLLESIRAHADAVRALLRRVGQNYSRDAMRADLLREIRGAHPGVPVVAFSQYAATIRGLFQEFRNERGVGALTASGARVAGGVISRRDALARFAPVASGLKPPREIDKIDFLLTTDLLSEGVNLQDAGVVVHLDLPWTAARLEQRLGRVRRLGSMHQRVHGYGIRPSTAAEALIHLERTIKRKTRETEVSVGGATPNLSVKQPALLRSPIAAAERIRTILHEWIIAGSGRFADNSIVAGAVAASQHGFLALIGEEPNFVLIGSAGNRVTEDPREILDILCLATDAEVPARSRVVKEALLRIQGLQRRALVLASLEKPVTVIAHNRHKILSRISAIVQSARPHERQRVVALAEKARTIVLSRLSAGAESDLLALASSDGRGEKWLERVIQQSSVGEVRRTNSNRIAAILLLDDSEVRSQN
ncbi:MAG: SNF2-related protein [Gemmatimonadaceae bacterium]